MSGRLHVVLGATGCVGRRLVRALVARGERVRALVRQPTTVLPDGIEVVRGDVFRRETLVPLMEGAEVVHYLVHAMGKQPHGGGDLLADERAHARNAFEVAKRAGSPRVVFVSGLGARREAPSAHLRGRFAVEEELRASGLPFAIFRAGILLGPGSVGFEVLLKAVRRAVVPLPPWTEIVMQPFALSDLIDLVVRASTEEAFAGRTVEVGTKDRPSYGDFLRRAARAMGRSPIFVPVPFALGPLAALDVALEGGVPLGEAQALTESMTTSPFVVEDGGDAMRALAIPERSLEDALQLGLRDAVAELAPGPPPPRGTFAPTLLRGT